MLWDQLNSLSHNLTLRPQATGPSPVSRCLRAITSRVDAPLYNAIGSSDSRVDPNVSLSRQLADPLGVGVITKHDLRAPTKQEGHNPGTGDILGAHATYPARASVTSCSGGWWDRALRLAPANSRRPATVFGWFTRGLISGRPKRENALVYTFRATRLLK